MEEIYFDWVSIFLASLLNLFVVWGWNSKWLFGPIPTDRRFWGIQFLLGGITSLCMAIFQGYLGVTSVTDGVLVGGFLWVGVTLPAQVSLFFRGFREGVLSEIFSKLLSLMTIGGFLGA